MKVEMNKLLYNEVELDIKAILEQCIRKFRLIFLVALVFSMLVPCLAYVLEVKEYNGVMSNSENATEIRLTELELATVDRYLAQRDKLVQLYNNKEESVVLNMDYESVYQGNIQIYVDAIEDVQYDIACAIENYINTQTFVEKYQELEQIENAPYSYELIGAEVAGSSYGLPSGIVKVRVWAENEEDCKNYVDIVKNLIQEYDVELQTSIADHKLKVVQEEYYCGYSKNVYESQWNYAKECELVATEMKTYAAALNENQLAYIAALDSADVQDNQVIAKPSFSLKFMILGFAVGVVFAMIIVFVQIIFGGDVQTEQEIFKRLSISNLGCLKNKSSNLIERLVSKLVYREEILELDKQVELVSAKTKAYLQNKQVQEVSLISTVDSLSNELIVKLQEKLKQDKIRCEIIGNIISDSDAYGKLTTNTNVIFVEMIGKSKIKEIYNESIICSEIGVDVIGYVSLRK